MALPLITTKLQIPTPRSGIITRPELMSHFSNGLSKKLILISAPTGYGKTTLITNWLANAGQGIGTAWISLDAEDNDPARFLNYLITSFQNVKPGAGQDVLAILSDEQQPPSSPLLSILINDLAAVDKDFFLVLDDYHLIDEPQVHALLNFLLDHLPERMHIVLLTRADPPLPLARLRAHGHLFEIRARDLKFTTDEAAEFLNTFLKMPLTDQDIQVLQERTEGWAAGLQLAALSLQGSPDASKIIDSLGSGNTYIVDYLIEEVLNRQSEEIRQFLLKTSILKRLNGPLCQALTGQADSAYILRSLEQANLFLISIDQQVPWYRYHQLFADVMSNRLRRFHPELLPELHHRAAVWHKENNLITEAIDHALLGEDFSFAADMAAENAAALLRKAGISTLIGWLEKYPEEVFGQFPKLVVLRVWAWVLAGKNVDVQGDLKKAEAQARVSGEYEDIRGDIHAVQAYQASRQGDFETALEQAGKALKYLPEDNYSTRSTMHFVLGRCYQNKADLPNALAEFKQASILGERSGSYSSAVSSLSSLGTMHMQLGNFSDAEAVFLQARNLAIGPSGNYLPIASTVLGRLAHLSIEKGDPEAAKIYAQDTVRLGEEWANGDSQVDGLLALARIAVLQSNITEANQCIKKAKDIAASTILVSDAYEGIQETEEYVHSQSARRGRAAVSVLIDPLSNRELEVLQLFSEGFSNQEIADQLIISLGTVKAHSSNIYRKLDVRNRAQAVAKAQELNLL